MVCWCGVGGEGEWEWGKRKSEKRCAMRCALC